MRAALSIVANALAAGVLVLIVVNPRHALSPIVMRLR